MYTREIAEHSPNRVAVVMPTAEKQWTFAEFEAEANGVAHLLRSAGIDEGDRIALVMTNSLEMLAVQAAAERTGLYHVPINWHLTPAETAFIINDSGARMVFSQDGLHERARELPGVCAGVEQWVMVDAPQEGEPFVDYRGALEGVPTTHVPNERTGRTLPYSSGTTGKPKGVLRALPGTDASQTLPIDERAIFAYQFREGMVFLEPAPMYHAAAHSHLSVALRVGGTSLIMERFDAETFLRLVAEYGVTHTAVVPTMMSRLLQLPDEVRARYDVSSLEAIVHSAAPCPPAVKQQMIDWVGPILWENLGSTEANGATIVSSQEWLERPGTVGRALFGEPVVLDTAGNELPAGRIGQIWWRGPTDFEYWNDPAKTAETIVDRHGPMSSLGDVGYIDDDGYMFLTDRASFTIIRGGVNIYPTEIENVLVEHPAVADVAVFGIPDDDLGEAVHALVELRPDHKPGPDIEEELIAFCREKLARYKCPTAVDFTDELPRLASGKVQKRLLRQRYVERSTADA